MKSGIASAALTFLALTGYPGCADAATTKAAPISTARPASPLVPADFDVPTSAEASGFRLVPLGPPLARMDFDAYMSSIAHLQKTFSRSTNWPREGISSADAMQDMQNEQARFESRKSFAYAVLTPDGTRERGCVYVSPSPVAGYDAVVRMWVTKADHDAGFDAELYKWVNGWIRTEWPFKNIAYPGRAIEWAAWDSLVAANKAGAPSPKRQNP